MAIIKFKDILKSVDYKYDKLTVSSVNKLIRFGINRLIGLLNKDNEVILQKNTGNIIFVKDFATRNEYFSYIKNIKLKKRNRENRLKTYYKNK